MKIKAWVDGKWTDFKDYIDRKAKKGGANLNTVNGRYKMDGKNYIVKADYDKGKEFSELLAGAFLRRVVAQPNFKYANNVALAYPGQDENGQVLIVQEQAKAMDVQPDRKKLGEIRERDEAKKSVVPIPRDQFAAMLVLSILVGDYSLHTGNFMIQQDGKGLRIDFGAAFKEVLADGHDTQLTQNPDGTKPYKRYVTLWTDDENKKRDLAAFMEANGGFLNPALMQQMIDEALDELFDGVYAEAGFEDLLLIYEHLNGKPYPGLTDAEITAYNEIKKLREEIDKCENDLEGLNQKPVKLESDLKEIAKLENELKSKKEQLKKKSDAFNGPQDLGPAQLANEERKAGVKADIKANMGRHMFARARNLINEVAALNKEEPAVREQKAAAQRTNDLDELINDDTKETLVLKRGEKVLQARVLHHVNAIARVDPDSADPMRGESRLLPREKPAGVYISVERMSVSRKDAKDNNDIGMGDYHVANESKNATGKDSVALAEDPWDLDKYDNSARYLSPQSIDNYIKHQKNLPLVKPERMKQPSPPVQNQAMLNEANKAKKVMDEYKDNQERQEFISNRKKYCGAQKQIENQVASPVSASMHTINLEKSASQAPLPVGSVPNADDRNLANEDLVVDVTEQFAGDEDLEKDVKMFEHRGSSVSQSGSIAGNSRTGAASKPNDGNDIELPLSHSQALRGSPSPVDAVAPTTASGFNENVEVNEPRSPGADVRPSTQPPRRPTPVELLQQRHGSSKPSTEHKLPTAPDGVKNRNSGGSSKGNTGNTGNTGNKM